MYSDDWLNAGYQHGEKIKVSKVVDYVIWKDDNDSVVGVSVNFERADDFHYDLPIDEWMKFLEKVINNTNFDKTQKLFGKFLEDNRDYLHFRML